jgi:hypothetical protein
MKIAIFRGVSIPNIPCAVKHDGGMWKTPSDIQVSDEPLGLSIAGHLAV